MKKVILTLLIILSISGVAKAQNGQSNSVTVTVVAPPSWTISVAPLNYYQNLAGVMKITVTAGTPVSACTVNWDAVVLANTLSGTVFTVPVPAAQTAVAGSHTVFISCPLPALSLKSPVTLPNAQVGQSYQADLLQLAQVTGGVPPYNFSLTGGGLPTGLSLGSGGVISGTPGNSGVFNFSFIVKDSGI